MSDTYTYTSKGYQVVEQDDLDVTPLWVGIVAVLREFSRDATMIQYGLETYYDWLIPFEVIDAECARLASEGFVILTDTHPSGGYKLTRDGLLLQAGDTELCPCCSVELVLGGEDGWRVCSKCDRNILMRTSDSDETTYHLHRARDAMRIFGRHLPPMGNPADIRVCLPVPQRD